MLHSYLNLPWPRWTFLVVTQGDLELLGVEGQLACRVQVLAAIVSREATTEAGVLDCWCSDTRLDMTTR